MPKLTWSEPENRRYEIGVDRGVLYPVSSAGVPWNGLVSVNETASGGESNPFYLDGVKYYNRPGLEEFAATLEAFTYPTQFEECDGTMELVSGLFAEHQRRKPFGLCYRTRVGNSVDPNLGYKIHIIYNLMAEPSERTFQTLGENVDPTHFSWALSAIPKTFDGAKPTAHLVVDSTKTEPGTMASLEAILYGGDSSAARLPNPDELVELFTSGLPAGAFTVFDFGDGSFTMSGEDSEISTPIDGQFTLNTDNVTDNGDGTYTATS